MIVGTLYNNCVTTVVRSAKYTGAPLKNQIKVSSLFSNFITSPSAPVGIVMVRFAVNTPSGKWRIEFTAAVKFASVALGLSTLGA